MGSYKLKCVKKRNERTINIVFNLQMMWLPIVIYVPALAFNQGMFCNAVDHLINKSKIEKMVFYGKIVTGVNVHLITPIVCVVCIFYTCVGGLKAVVWTDVVQLVMMFGAICLVIIKGTMDVGGFGFVWQKASESGRIEFPEYVMN